KGEIKAKNSEDLVARYHHPEPRNAIANLLRENATSAMDISDGFVGDLQKLCAVSGVSADVELEKIPYSGAAAALIAKDESLRETMLTGGDDYEILFTIPHAKWKSFAADAAKLKIPVTEVGVITKGKSGPQFTYEKEPRTFWRGSYQHF
ncbi:MAG: AIR synthase-related protein, partial [Pseudomonadota bacterium]